LRRIGEDVSEKLDYTPGVFRVERHVSGKWACAKCERLVQAPVPAQVIDKGIPTAGLLAQVLVAKYADHSPLYRQEAIFGRAGLAIPRSTLAQWVGVCGVRLQPLVEAMKAALLAPPVLHADETPVAMLKPGHGKTHRAYLWSWCSTAFDPFQAVVYDFAETRGGLHPKAFLGAWTGTLVCDDYSGYKGLFGKAVIEAGCMAHYPEDSLIRTCSPSCGCCRRQGVRPALHINPARPEIRPCAGNVCHAWSSRKKRPHPVLSASCRYGVPTETSGRRARKCICGTSPGSGVTAESRGALKSTS
jgi:transposase